MITVEKQKSHLRAGAAMVDVTSPAGTHLGGTLGRLCRAETLVDRLYALALVVEKDGCTLCHETAHLEIITEHWAAFVRRKSQRPCAIPVTNCMVSAAHVLTKELLA